MDIHCLERLRLRLDLAFDDLNPRVLMFNMASYGIFRSPRHRPVILTASGSTLAWRRPAPQALADTFDSASLRVSCGCCGYSPNSSHLREIGRASCRERVCQCV